MISFDQLKTLVEKLVFPDPGLFGKIGIQQLSTQYIAYATTVDGVPLCILVQKGTNPKAASRLSEDEARKGKVIVLKKEGMGWTKAWPFREE
jgi:hypothetical protein